MSINENEGIFTVVKLISALLKGFSVIDCKGCTDERKLQLDI